MSEILVTPRPQTDWGQLGTAIASPFAQQQAQQQALQQQLMGLVFKSQLDRQNKLAELELEHQFEMRRVQDFKNMNPDKRIRAKLQGGKTVLESLDTKEIAEEEAAERAPRIGGVLSYISKAAQEGASPKVYREATKRYTTPEEIKNIMGAYETGRKAKPKLTKFTESEQNYLKSSQRVMTNLGDVLGYLNSDKYSDENNFAVQSLPFLLIQDQDVESFKRALNRLKADIPFMRGGKQLTPTEAKRVDSLLSPLGKSKDTYARDIEDFYNEFLYGESLVKGKGKIPTTKYQMQKDTDTGQYRLSQVR